MGFRSIHTHTVASGIALLTHTSKFSSNASTVTSNAIDTTGANFIIVTIAYYQVVPTFLDSAGNTWTLVRTDVQATNDHLRTYICYSPITSATHTFSANGSGGNTYPAIAISSWSGVLSSGLDKQSGAGANSASSIQPGSITPTVNKELLICVFASDNAATSSQTINSPFTKIEGFGSQPFSLGVGMAWYIQPTAGAINPTWSFSGNSLLISSIFSFKPQ